VVGGTCPNLTDLALPDADGDHTLELTSQFPNGDPVTQSLSISFLTAGSGQPVVASPGSSSLLPPTLVVTKAKFKQATVSWLPAIGDVASHRLYIDGKLVGSYSAKDRTARIPGLTRDTLYRATLVAFDRNNQSAFSQADFWTMNQKRLIIYFSGDSPKITKPERKRLRSLVRSLPANYKAEMTVVATVKRIPGRSFASNKALADARAKNVTRLLKKLGLEASFSVVGIGVPESAQDRSRKTASKLRYVRLV
jgi:outer membrane protein OmpA-like peptidoglycan-associated protein